MWWMKPSICGSQTWLNIRITQRALVQILEEHSMGDGGGQGGVEVPGLSHAL